MTFFKLFISVINKRISLAAAAGALIPIKEKEFSKIDFVQESILDCLHNYKQVQIVGGAGTGKTFIGIKKAVRDCIDGKKVLFICCNSELAKFVDSKISDHYNIDSCTYDELMLKLLGEKYLQVTPNENGNRCCFELLDDVPLNDKYDSIIVDEAQDLSAVQRELLFKCQKMGTRYAFFGDENQSIYNFAGADIESFRRLKRLPNTTSLPLSISYRCADNIVKFAQNYVSSIESNDDGRKGEVKYNGELEDIKDGDMVLCRNNAPLLRLYNDFMKLGKKCYIRGKDIGLNLIQFLNSVEEETLNLDLMEDGVFVRLYQNLFETRNSEMMISGLDEETVMNSSKLANRLDMIHALETLSEDIGRAAR